MDEEKTESTVEEQDLGPQAQEYANLLSERDSARAEFDQRLEASPETAQFAEEIKHPDYIEDEKSGIKYAVYELNKDKEGDPVVINLAWSVGADTPVGRNDLSAYAQKIDRPLKVIDMEATGKTEVPNSEWRKSATFEEIAASHLRVVDKMDVDNFDLVGYSMGGVVSAKMAALAGDRVKNLVTISAPGFSELGLLKLARGFVVDEAKFAKEYSSSARESIQEQSKKAGHGTYVGPRNLGGVMALAKYASLMAKPTLEGISKELSPQTHWVDVVGSKEAITDYADHLAVVGDRNLEHPHSSKSHILGSESHSWGLNTQSVAEVASAYINDPAQPNPK